MDAWYLPPNYLICNFTLLRCCYVFYIVVYISLAVFRYVVKAVVYEIGILADTDNTTSSESTER